MTKKPVMRGKELQKAIIDLARLHRYKVAHFQSVLATRKDGSASWRTPVAADGAGFPDLLLAREGRLVVIEVKGDGDYLKPEQEAWINTLLRADVETYVWGPGQLRDGTIEQVLA